MGLNVELGYVIHHKGLPGATGTQLVHPTGPGERWSFDVIGAALQVHKQVGPGLLESAYDACLCRELTLRAIPYQRQVPLPLKYRGISIDCGYRLDLLVGHLVVVELKSVAKVLPIHRAQVMTYLKLLKVRLGLIINFNVTALHQGVYRIAQD